MVVVEALAEKAPALCSDLEKILIEVFSTKDIPVQGDILYALGEIGTPTPGDWIAAQQEALSHEDLKDAAKDAIQSILRRNLTSDKSNVREAPEEIAVTAWYFQRSTLASPNRNI